MDFSTAFWDRYNSRAFHYTCRLNLDPEFLLKIMRFDLNSNTQFWRQGA